MELKDITKWDDFSKYIDTLYVPMVKNGIQPVYGFADPVTFGRLQNALFERFSPNERPSANEKVIELILPNIGSIPLSCGMGNIDPYIFFAHGDF